MFEADWATLWAGALTNGVIGRAGTSAASTALQVYSTQDGRQVYIRPGNANIRGHLFKSDATVTLPIGLNTSGSSRTDIVVVRLDVPNKTAYLAVVVGTPGAGAPTLTQNIGGIWEIPLAQVTAENNFGNIPNNDLADLRSWAAPVYFDKWTSYTPTLAANGSGPVPSGSTTGRFKVVGDTCLVAWSGSVTVSGGAASTDSYLVSLPVSPARDLIAGSAMVQSAPGVVTTSGNNAVVTRASLGVVPVSQTVTLDGSGNGYADFPTIPWSTFSDAFVGATNPPSGGYPNYPVLEALQWSTYTRVVMTEGTPSGTFTITALGGGAVLTPGTPFNDSFSLTYEIAPGA